MDEYNDLVMHLCDVASVSQLCTFPLYLFTWVVVKITSLATIVFNAVMPLSRASTRRRYLPLFEGKQIVNRYFFPCACEKSMYFGRFVCEIYLLFRL